MTHNIDIHFIFELIFAPRGASWDTSLFLSPSMATPVTPAVVPKPGAPTPTHMAHLKALAKSVMALIEAPVLSLDEKCFIPELQNVKAKAIANNNVQQQVFCDVAISMLTEVDNFLATHSAATSATVPATSSATSTVSSSTKAGTATTTTTTQGQ